MKTSEFFGKRYLKLPCSRFAGCLESDGHYKMNVCIIWASLRNNRNSLYKCNLPDNALAPAGSIFPAFVFIGTNRISKNRMSVVRMPECFWGQVGCDVRLWRCGCEDLFYR